MRRLSAVFAAALLVGPAAAPVPAQKAPATPARFGLTVDSIMRGPDLVGWTPAGLRWSADATPPPGTKAEREIRWWTPVVSGDGKYVVAEAPSTDNKDRWFVTLDFEDNLRVKRMKGTS